MDATKGHSEFLSTEIPRNYQLKIWTATNYTKNKNCLIKASSELINSNQRRKIPQADLVSLRLTIQEESITKLISSSSNSTATNESSISKKTSSITSVENVQFILHINEQKKTRVDKIKFFDFSSLVSTSSSSLTKYPKNMTIPNYLYITVIRLPNYANS
ncbi:unnamed protein product [Rotaria sp. Silwood2]|nr:unnamed protein product [Rotaria sp. Silwood2]